MDRVAPNLDGGVQAGGLFHQVAPVGVHPLVATVEGARDLLAALAGGKQVYDRALPLGQAHGAWVLASPPWSGWRTGEAELE